MKIEYRLVTSPDRERALLVARIYFDEAERFILPEFYPKKLKIDDLDITVDGHLSIWEIAAQAPYNHNAMTVNDYPSLKGRLEKFIRLAKDAVKDCLQNSAYVEEGEVDLDVMTKQELAAVVFAMKSLDGIGKGKGDDR